MTRGGDEAADLDFAAHQAAAMDRDPAHFRLGGHAGLGDLQAVARADLADGDEWGGCLESLVGVAGALQVRMLPVSDTVHHQRAAGNVEAGAFQEAIDWLAGAGAA